MLFLIITIIIIKIIIMINISPNLSQTARLYNNQQKKKKRTCRIVNLAVPADHRVTLKESKKKNKYLDLARGLKKQWNMKVMVVPIVIGTLGTVTKGLVKGLEDLEIRGLEDLEIRGQMEAIQTTELLRSTRRVEETWENLSLKLHWKTIG